MYLKEVECSNYRSYGEGTIFHFKSGLNIIVGGNNSGKSNIIKAIEAIFKKLRNLTQIRNSEYLIDEKDHIKYELPSESPNISEEEFHNKNQRLTIKLRLTFSLEKKDNKYLGHLIQLLENTPHGKKQPPGESDKVFEGKAKEADFVFEIFTHSSGEAMMTQKAFAIVRFDKELKEKKLNIGNYLTDKFSFDRLTQLLKDSMIIFPEFRMKPQSRQTSDIIVDPSGENLPLILYNLRNRRDPGSQDKFDEIVKQFKKLFELKLQVSKGPVLEFIKQDGTIIGTEGLGGGLIEILNILTHIILEENMIFILDEPESHLHPQGRRLLKQILLEYSRRNQLIVITHSPELFGLEDLDRITLVRQNEGRSELCTIKSNLMDDAYLKNAIKKFRRVEYKELFFAKKVILVEGETEVGAIPIFATKLKYDFDRNSVSIIPVLGNYFVVFARILHEFQIPCLIVCDSDVMMNVSNTVKMGQIEAKTSSIFSQMDYLDLLSDSDKNTLVNLSKSITSSIQPKWAKSKECQLVQQLNSRPEIPLDVKTTAEQIYREHQTLAYEDAKQSDIRRFLLKLARKYHINIRILDSNFEGIFESSKYGSLLKTFQSQFGRDKVLMGTYLASNIALKDIPRVIRDIVNELKTL